MAQPVYKLPVKWTLVPTVGHPWPQKATAEESCRCYPLWPGEGDMRGGKEVIQGYSCAPHPIVKLCRLYISPSLKALRALVWFPAGEERHWNSRLDSISLRHMCIYPLHSQITLVPSSRTTLKKTYISQGWWHMPIIPILWEVEARRSQIWNPTSVI